MIVLRLTENNEADDCAERQSSNKTQNGTLQSRVRKKLSLPPSKEANQTNLHATISKLQNLIFRTHSGWSNCGPGIWGRADKLTFIKRVLI